MNFSCGHYGFFYEDTTAFKVNIIMCTILDGIFVIPAIFMNATVLLLLWKDRKILTTWSSLLINLVVTDLITGFFTMPILIAEFAIIVNGSEPCAIAVVTTPISFVLGIVSFTTLSILAIDRYVKFYHPYHHRSMSKKEVLWLEILFSWALPIFPVVKTIVDKRMATMDQFVTYVGATFVTINVFCHTRIYCLIRKQRRKIQAEQLRFSNARVAKEKNLAILGSLLLVSIVFCYLPVVCLSGLAIETKRNSQRIIGYLTYWAWTLVAFNSVMNPIIKFYRLASIREGVAQFYMRFLNAQSNRVTAFITKSNVDDRRLQNTL